MSSLCNGRQVFVNGSGQTLAAGKVFVYIYGTTDLASVYQDVNETVPANTNPDGSVPLDASGSALLFGTGRFTFVAYDQYGNQVPGESGPVEGTVSPAMQSATSQSTLASGLAVLGGLPASTPVGFTQVTTGSNQPEAASGAMYVNTTGITIDLPATATLTDAFYFAINCVGGSITLQPNAADEIDGITPAGTPVTFIQGQSALLTTDANGNWWTAFFKAPGGFMPTVVAGGALGVSSTYTVPNGVFELEIQVWGGGAAGQPADSTHAGGGGGGGGYGSAEKAVVPGEVLSYYAPFGGTAVALGTSAGSGADGATGFVGEIIATGGTVGAQGSGSDGSGGLGGSGTLESGFTTPSLLLYGQPGGAGQTLVTSVHSAGWGGGSFGFGLTPGPMNGSGVPPSWGYGGGGPGGAGDGTSGHSGTNGQGGLVIITPVAAG